MSDIDLEKLSPNIRRRKCSRTHSHSGSHSRSPASLHEPGNQVVCSFVDNFRHCEDTMLLMLN